MRVYRYMCEEELASILDGSMNRVGTTKINNASNTHHYKPGVKYLHFFKNLEDLQDIRMIKKYNKNVFYVGLFDIPLPTLLLNSGKGYYEPHGYDSDRVIIKEYAVPADKIKPEYLVFYMQDKERNVTHQEVKDGEDRCKVLMAGVKPACPYEIKREDSVLAPTKQGIQNLISSGIVTVSTAIKTSTYLEEKVQ